MGKVVSIPPPIPKADIDRQGTEVTIKEARLATDLTTTLGKVKQALGLVVEVHGDEYSHVFSLDSDVIAGSVGRLLVSVGIEDTEAEDFEANLQKLVGQTVIVKNRGDKLYWYP